MKFKGKYSKNIHAGREKGARIISRSILKLQSAFARFMSKKTEKISSSSMKMLLAVFFLSGSALSIYFITTAIIEKEQLKTVKVEHLRVPKSYEDAADSMEHDFFIAKKTYREMQAFKNYMDSLRQTKGMYDSIMRYCPGLTDSIHRLEQLYKHKK
jgi:hypothetical protein